MVPRRTAQPARTCSRGVAAWVHGAAAWTQACGLEHTGLLDRVAASSTRGRTPGAPPIGLHPLSTLLLVLLLLVLLLLVLLLLLLLLLLTARPEETRTHFVLLPLLPPSLLRTAHLEQEAAVVARPQRFGDGEARPTAHRAPRPSTPCLLTLAEQANACLN